MVESRVIVDDIKATKKRIEKIGGVLKNSYAFTDIIFVPKSGEYNLNEEFIRLRIYETNNWDTKDIILTYKKMEWKNKAKTDKVVLRKEFETVEEGMTYIETHFQDWKRGFEYFRRGWEYHINSKKVFVEDIKGFGYSVEAEASSEKELDDLFVCLNVRKRFSDSMAETMRKILIK